MTRDDSEPEVVLLSGERVTEALFTWVANLLRKGHEIVVAEDGHVSIVPEVNADLAWCIQSSPWATRAILDDLRAPKTLH